MPDQNRIGRGFDSLTPVYDACVYLVFKNTFNDLQHEALSSIGSVENCLIIGGGSGQILRSAIDLNIARQYHYCELSEKMIAKTKNRLSPEENQQVHFCADYNSINQSIDLILLPFVLDCYPTPVVSEMLTKLKKLSNQKGQVLIIDFNEEEISGFKPNSIQRLFLKLLYFFFKVFAGIEATSLPPIYTLCNKADLTLVRTWSRKKGWIRASLWTHD